MALYSKYRPKTFDEVVGQEHITTTLKNEIMSNNIAHAYLLCGIRGTGKTTLARIIGKTVNCEHPVNGNPCLECDMCKGIENGTLLNVIEIDAASNTGVDNIRNIIDDAVYMPQNGKYKVYIIDETHMLSKSAFNALLKILEEPPKHVIFILATTESQKLLPTIVSRCQKFDLKRIAKAKMFDKMKDIVSCENIEIEDDAIKYIYELSEGSMRDGLSLLEQIFSIKENEEIRIEDVLDVLGNVDYKTLNDFTLGLENKDIKGCIEKINEIYDNGKDIGSFVSLYCGYLRNLILIASNTNFSMLDMSDENAQMIKETAGKINLRRLIFLLDSFVNVEREMKYSNMPKLVLEMLVIRLCKEDEVYQEAPKSSTNTETQAPKAAPVRKPVARKVESIEKGDIESYRDAWAGLVEATANEFAKSKLKAVSINSLEDNNVYMTAPLEASVDYVLSMKDRLEKALPTIDGKVITINIVTEAALNSAVNKEQAENNKLSDEDASGLQDQFSKFGIEVNVE